MTYNITAGWYKLYYTWGIDGVNYPNEYECIVPLFISDENFGTSQLTLVSGNSLTSDGERLLNTSNMRGLVNTYHVGYRFSSAITEDVINSKTSSIINMLGVMGISFRLPSYSEYVNVDTVFYNVYLDKNHTILIDSGNMYKSISSSVERLFSADTVYIAYDARMEVTLPVIQVNSECTTLKVTQLDPRPENGKVYYSNPEYYNNWLQYFDNLEPFVEDTDPYSKGGDTETGGGTGDFDGTSDDISIPELPTLSATSTNFITLFNPSLGELQNLANYMWSDLFDLDTFKKIFADPMDCILGLSIVPVAVPSGGSKAVTVGNISTGVTMQVASAQYVSVDCGTLNVNEYWGAYLDYDPYTKAEIYLPYIGTHPIAVDDIMGKAVHVVYHVDILSGACTAYVQCGGSVLYSFIGQCSASIPITGNDWTNVINGVLSIAGSIGSMVATGGMSAPLTALQAPVTAAKVGGALATGSSLASTAVNSLKPSVEKSGSMSGVGGMLAVQTPYIILTRPRQARPKQQNTYTGYPSFITSKLSKLTGYTEIEVIHMDGLTCTDAEAIEIESLLKSGVIF